MTDGRLYLCFIATQSEFSMKNLERPLNVTDNFDFMWYFYMQFSLLQSFRLKDSSSCEFRVIIRHGVAVLSLPRDLLHSNAFHPTNQPNEWMWNIETASDETVANGMKYCNFILLIKIWYLASLLMSMPPFRQVIEIEVKCIRNEFVFCGREFKPNRKRAYFFGVVVCVLSSHVRAIRIVKCFWLQGFLSYFTAEFPYRNIENSIDDSMIHC